MRSSNYKHLNNKDNLKAKHAQPVNKVKRFSKLGSLVVTAFIIISAIVIPSISLVQNVAAVSDGQKSTLNVGDSDILNKAIDAETEKETKATEPTAVKETEPKTEPETEEVTEAVTEEETEEDTEEEAVSCSSGNHIELSDYDRTLLEGLVMGEAGVYGYEGSALVAQAIHDSMIESGTTSVESIAYEYKYDASMSNVPSSEVKEAVSFIFDNDGRAVDHRILYFYSSDIVSSDWHESQNFITSCGSMRFFDKW